MQVMSNSQSVQTQARNLAEFVAECLRSQGVEATTTPVAAALNGAFVPRSAWAITALKQGDAIELVAPMTGG